MPKTTIRIRAEPECWQCLTDHREDQGETVDGAATPNRRDHPERHTDHESKPHCQNSDRQRDGQPASQQIDDRHLEEKAVAEIAARRIPEPLRVLHEDRAIETMECPDLLDILATAGGARKSGCRVA